MPVIVHPDVLIKETISYVLALLNNTKTTGLKCCVYMSVNGHNFKFVYNFDWNVVEVEFAVAYFSIAILRTIFYSRQ